MIRGRDDVWIPVFTGMTIPVLVVQMLMVGLASIQEKDMQRISRPFRRFGFASRRGISTIPEGDINKTVRKTISIDYPKRGF